MLLDEIGARLSTQGIASSSGEGSPAWYLWKSQMPDSTDIADRGVAVTASGGLPQLPNIQIDRPTFQVVVRGARLDVVSTAYEEAALKAEQIKMNLHFLTDTALSGVTYAQIQAAAEPSYIGEDANLRPLFTCNFTAWRDSTSSS